MGISNLCIEEPSREARACCVTSGRRWQGTVEERESSCDLALQSSRLGPRILREQWVTDFAVLRGGDVVHVGRPLRDFYERRASWDSVKPYLECVFAIVHPTTKASPGKEFAAAE